MVKHFHEEIEKLKKKILSLSIIVDENVRSAVRAFLDNDEELARETILKDSKIDELEVEVEEMCLKVLVLHQPVAVDLRFIVAVLKINNDLERIGDLGVSIAKRSKDLARKGRVEIPFKLIEMSEIVLSMIRKSLDALVNMDKSIAKSVREEDSAVDTLHRQNYIDIQAEIQANPDKMETLINYLSVSRYLERIADHTTNIAEDIIYMIEGEIVRHQSN